MTGSHVGVDDRVTDRFKHATRSIDTSVVPATRTRVVIAIFRDAPRATLIDEPVFKEIFLRPPKDNVANAEIGEFRYSLVVFFVVGDQPEAMASRSKFWKHMSCVSLDSLERDVAQAAKREHVGEMVLR